MNSFARR